MEPSSNSGSYSHHPFFTKGDNPHSRAKREILEGSLHQFFGARLKVGNTVRSGDPFQVV